MGDYKLHLYIKCTESTQSTLNIILYCLPFSSVLPRNRESVLQQSQLSRSSVEGELLSKQGNLSACLPEGTYFSRYHISFDSAFKFIDHLH